MAAHSIPRSLVTNSQRLLSKSCERESQSPAQPFGSPAGWVAQYLRHALGEPVAEAGQLLVAAVRDRTLSGLTATRFP